MKSSILSRKLSELDCFDGKSIKDGDFLHVSKARRAALLNNPPEPDKLIELERRVNARVRDLVRLKHAAMDAIDAIDGADESRLREVLELYYIDGYSWERVAETMELDKRWVFRLHGRALQRIKVPKDEEAPT